jgi:hypothetical protein
MPPTRGTEGGERPDAFPIWAAVREREEEGHESDLLTGSVNASADCSLRALARSST